MSFASFLFAVLVIYAVYYGIVIAIDLLKKDKVKSSNEEEFDINDISIKEEYQPQDAEILYQTEYARSQEDEAKPIEIEDEPQEEDVNYIDADALVDEEESQRDLNNITNHGGYTPSGLKELLSEIIKEGQNPFSTITTQMI